MKILPPKVVVDDADPFKDALFGRKDFGTALTALLQNSDDPLVVFVNAPWGAGKTTFSEMWRAHLRQQKFHAVYFDAFAADYFEDPFVSFTAEILAFAKKHWPEETKAARGEFKNAAVNVGKKVASIAVKAGLKAVTLGVIDKAAVDALKEIGSEIASGISDAGGAFVEKKLDEFASEKDALLHFRSTLQKLAAAVRTKQRFPLTIVVDELDRCRPDFALNLLERIKHLFEVEGVAFVLLLNQSQIEGHIRKTYGCDADGARSYLLKFGSVFVDLPKRSDASRQYEPGRDKFCATLIEHFQLPTPPTEAGILAPLMVIISEHFGLTFREIEKAIIAINLYYVGRPQGAETNAIVVCILAVLRLRHHELYASLARGTATEADFFSVTRLDRLPDPSGYQISSKHVASLFRFFLMSRENYDNQPAGSDVRELSKWYRGDREKLLSAYCARLEQFSLQPR